MKLPRDVSGQRLAKRSANSATSSPASEARTCRYTTEQHGQQHIAIPDHDSLRIGTLGEILKDVAAHHSMTVPELVAKLEL